MPKLEAFVLRMNFNFKWIEPHCAPQCLLIRVKKIEILSLGGQKDEMELVKCLLKNGEGLNRMMIVFTNSAPKKKLRQELLRLERGSTNCEVQFLLSLRFSTLRSFSGNFIYLEVDF